MGDGVWCNEKERTWGVLNVEMTPPPPVGSCTRNIEKVFQKFWPIKHEKVNFPFCADFLRAKIKLFQMLFHFKKKKPQKMNTVQ